MKDIQLRKFPLFGRYGEKRFIKEIEKNVFKLYGDLDYMRIIFSDDGKDIYAIDPPGGPFIRVNFPIKDNLLVTKIDFDKETGDYLIHTKDYVRVPKN